MATQLTTETRERVLIAAGQVFAARGFKEATVREICQVGSVNIAAVNYYFGDKERLYIESVKRAHRNRLGEHPAPTWPDGVSPQQKLRDFVGVLLARMLQDPSEEWHTQLMLRELVQPTAACVELVRDYIKPQHEMLLRIIDELVPPDTSPERRQLIGFSIVGQCLFHRVARPIVEQLVGDEAFQNHTLDYLADHITNLSLAALSNLSAEVQRT